MKITMTAGELIDKFLWDDVCEMRGLNVWSVNEGRMDEDEEFSFTEEEAKRLGI